MTYQEQFEKAEKAGQATDLVVEFLKLEEGDEVVGVLVGIEEYINTKPDAEISEPCKRYILKTDDKLGSVLLGSATDAQLLGKVKIGLLTYIRFDGRMPIDGGKRNVNRWTFKQVSESVLISEREE